jgi:hypothetical protein
MSKITKCKLCDKSEVFALGICSHHYGLMRKGKLTDSQMRIIRDEAPVRPKWIDSGGWAGDEQSLIAAQEAKAIG